MSAQSHVRHAAAALGLAAALLACLARAGAATDPCTLLSANEAQAYVDQLATPPFRADDNGAANPRGTACVYRGTGGKQISLLWNASGAAEAGSITDSAPNTLGGVFEQAGQPGLAANAHRIIAQGPQGPWDHANWIPGGSLFVNKADQGIIIDMSRASGSEDEAVAVARLAVPRFNHPLAYDGARAAMNAPKAKAHGAACTVLAQAAVEAAVGKLAGAPSAGSDGNSCEYRVATAQGQRTYPVEYVWQGGLKNYNMLKNGPATMGAAMGGNIPMNGLNSIPQDPQTSALIGGLMKMVGGNDAGAAPGAPTQIGFKTDSNLKGPWDNATVMHGTQLFAVKADVMVGMDLKSADYEKAKALMAAICSRL
ncbi:MAG TPA: hypothetical protein VHW95_08425 [Steroidobacteraceae bacterium]|nr:hypothetical protein [Steroidobacteraceae bacterium]